MGHKERKAFANVLGMHPDTLGGYERGDTFPDQAFLARYKREFSVNLNWLFTGEGEMFLPGKVTPLQPTYASSHANRLTPEETARLERAITIIEDALAEFRREAKPSVKAGMITAAFEMLEEPSEASVSRILRLVKG